VKWRWTVELVYSYSFAHNVMLLASMYLGLSTITKDCSRHTSVEAPKPFLLNFGNLVSDSSHKSVRSVLLYAAAMACCMNDADVQWDTAIQA
jgi:hypothetical protein